ncbi:MAG: hypothetical protein A2297_07145 [Elusimicrobia bacterium RIFOXYB2_FULL_48_7]|nr:MAG: hypothetical protein A2297_07145 [Elusimicrobia bacterium RIFOXYB2_FULL_48_7]
MASYSHSRLKAFENCPLQYKFIYIDRIDRHEEGIEAFLGSRFHEVMEELYKTLKFKLYPLPELLKFYENAWDKKFTDKLIITKENLSAADYKNLGRKFIEGYYKMYQPFDQAVTLGLEKGIAIPIDAEGKYKVTGYLDRIALTKDGAYEIHDYKTSGTLSEQKYLDSDRQLALYQIGLEKMWCDVKKVNLIWHFVAFDKEMVSTRTPEQLENLKRSVIGIIQKIESTREFLPEESALCEWCSYQDLCPKRKHQFFTEALPENEFLKNDGVQLVDAYAKASAELTELRKEAAQKTKTIEETLQKIREAAVAYAKNEKIEVVMGSTHKLSIKDKRSASIPKKGSLEREKLESIIKEINKWSEVSTLDASAFEKVVVGGAWPEEITGKIAPLLLVETKTSVTLSKLKQEEE